jgi:hypothetical protein
MRVNNLFKFQAQENDLEYLFWRFEKDIALSEKKNTFIYVLHLHQNHSVVAPNSGAKTYVSEKQIGEYHTLILFYKQRSN